ncbi:unnamed protein product [Penicillium roqueforti FM164]|uniref:Genomic scaffold, ProqFM164S01 n=1 Tax=Penicillium roqueforti (strain FM164) TaxID=1365484 RepID=W6QCM2_PENRF|nr:unnamed protein product [Penicillium roqueforti FM164]
MDVFVAVFRCARETALSVGGDNVINDSARFSEHDLVFCEGRAVVFDHRRSAGRMQVFD